MSSGRFLEAYRRGYSVMPVVGEGVSAMSSERQASLLRGLDPVVVLEAASTVLVGIEQGSLDAVVDLLPQSDRAGLRRWYETPRREIAAAPVPVHPLAALAATTLALGQSVPGPRSDDLRREAAGAITRVGLRLNGAVLGAASDDRETLALMARSALWRAVEQEDWMIWSGELVQDLSSDPAAAPLRAAFEHAANLTIAEWWYRCFGERATRAIHGARSWKAAERVNLDLEMAWIRLVTTPVEDAVRAARAALTRRRPQDPPTVIDPFDLMWLASRPVVVTADERRFQLWIGANNRCLLPAGIAQTVSETTGTSYLEVAERIGRIAERRLTSRVEAVPEAPGEVRVPEALMPPGISKCDYLVDQHDTLVGFEFTIATPSRALGAGKVDAVDALVARIADKVQQAYSTFRWRDPDRRKRWLPVLVFVSPTAVDPLLNELAHGELVRRGLIHEGGSSELMTCHAPEFLDLLQYCADKGLSLVEGVVAWRDGDLRGTALDWWLAEHDALRSSGRRRVSAVADAAEGILTRARAG